MKPVYQARTNCVDGNCWPACLATYFGVDLEEVDHLHCGSPTWVRDSQKWLKRRGLYFVQLQFTFSSSVEGQLTPSQHWTTLPHGMLVLGGGLSKTKRPHICIYRIRNEQFQQYLDLVHDPMGADSKGLDVVTNVVIFGKLPKQFNREK